MLLLQKRLSLEDLIVEPRRVDIVRGAGVQLQAGSVTGLTGFVHHRAEGVPRLSG